MYSNQDKKTIPILPYCNTLGYSMIVYDNMTYTRNISLCSDEMVKKESGNVIKFYRCKITPPKIIQSIGL